MGIGTISGLVTSLAVQQVFMPTKAHEIRLWQHSVITAVAARYLSFVASSVEISAGEAYLAGLLHDIGRSVMLEHAAPNLLKVDESNWGTPEELIQADLAIYKFTHSELGYLACNRWSVPDQIASVVREHHRALTGRIKPASSDALCFCVQMADRLAIAVIEKRVGQDELAKAVAELIQFSIPRGNPNDLVPADALLRQIPKIDAESERLLSGLGFGRA